MRSLPLLVILLAALPIGAAQVYRWVDKDGVVHYSDRPAPGAEVVPLVTPPKPGSVAPVSVPSAARSSETPARPAEVRYGSCEITSPSEDQIFSQTDGIPVVIEAQPGLQSGDSVTVLMNGSALEWPKGSLSSRLGPQPRGSYTLAAKITGPDGGLKCATAPLTFNVFQPSLLTPGRQRSPR